MPACHFLCLVSVRPCGADRSVSLLSQSVGPLSHPSCPPFLIWLYPPMKYQLIWLVFSVSPPVCFLCFCLSPILSASFVCSTVPRCPVCACPFATLHLSWRTNCVPVCCSSCPQALSSGISVCPPEISFCPPAYCAIMSVFRDRTCLPYFIFVSLFATSAGTWFLHCCLDFLFPSFCLHISNPCMSIFI